MKLPVFTSCLISFLLTVHSNAFASSLDVSTSLTAGFNFGSTAQTLHSSPYFLQVKSQLRPARAGELDWSKLQMPLASYTYVPGRPLVSAVFGLPLVDYQKLNAAGEPSSISWGWVAAGTAIAAGLATGFSVSKTEDSSGDNNSNVNRGSRECQVADVEPENGNINVVSGNCP